MKGRWLSLWSTRLVTCRGPQTIVARQKHVRNMYGCLPCPWCGSGYRYVMTRSVQAGCPMIECDDCGKRQRAVMKDY